MIYLYDEFTQDVEYNGYVLNTAYDADIHRVSNGIYKLTFKVPIADNEEYTLIKENMVVKADEHDRFNLFRIKYVDRSDTERFINVTCYQMCYDFAKKLVNNFSFLDETPYNALARWKASFVHEEKLLAYDADFDNIKTSTYSSATSEDDKDYKNSFETLYAIANAYSADVDFDKWCVRLHEKYGRDTEEVLTTSKNISSFVDETNADEIYTRIIANATYKPDVDKDEIRKRQKEERDALRVSQKEKTKAESVKRREEKIKREIETRYSTELAKASRKRAKRGSKPTLTRAQIEQTVRSKYAKADQTAEERKAIATADLNRKKAEMEALKEKQKEEFESATAEISFSVVVESALIDDYPFINEIHLTNNEVETVEELEEWARTKFDIENIDKPKRSIKVDYEQLKEDIHLGDTLILKHINHDIDERMRVVETHYDPMSRRYTSFVLGESGGSFGESVNSSIVSSSNSIVSNAVGSFGADFNRLYEQEKENFTRRYEAKVKEIQDTVNDGIETAKASAQIYADNLKNQIDEKVTEATKDIPQIRADFENSMNDTKAELLEKIENVDISDDLKNKISKLETTSNSITGKVASLENDVLKQSDINITDEGISLGAGKLFDATKMASMFSVKPEAVKAITDEFVITANNENLLRTEAERNFTISNTRNNYANNWYKNEGAYKLKAGDEFLISGEIVGNNPHQSVVGIAADTNAGTKWWGATLVNANETGKRTATLKLPAEVDNLNISRYRIYTNINVSSNHGSRTFKDLSVIKKKDASFIVDGSIKSNHVDTNSLRTGILTAGSINANHIATNAIEAKHMKLDNAMIDKMFSNESVVNKLTSQTAFITNLNSVLANTSVRHTIGNFTIGTGQHIGGGTYSGGHYITGRDNYRNGMSDGKGSQAAFWANWGDWNKPGDATWLVSNSGNMTTKGVSSFLGKTDFHHKDTTFHNGFWLHGNIRGVAGSVYVDPRFNFNNGITGFMMSNNGTYRIYVSDNGNLFLEDVKSGRGWRTVFERDW